MHYANRRILYFTLLSAALRNVYTDKTDSHRVVNRSIDDVRQLVPDVTVVNVVEFSFERVRDRLRHAFLRHAFLRLSASTATSLIADFFSSTNMTQSL